MIFFVEFCHFLESFLRTRWSLNNKNNSRYTVENINICFRFFQLFFDFRSFFLWKTPYTCLLSVFLCRKEFVFFCQRFCSKKTEGNFFVSPFFFKCKIKSKKTNFDLCEILIFKNLVTVLRMGIQLKVTC